MKAEKFEIESDRLSRISHPERLAADRTGSEPSGSDFGHCGAATRPV
jgi:hypothetical protein